MGKIGKNKLVSVVMSTYNENPVWIKQSIESILNQTYKNFEFIIVLDNPENQINNNIIRNYAKKDSRIRVIENEKNIGLANSLNVGLKVSRGEYIARMDADDIALDNRLEVQLDKITKYDLDGVGSNVNLIDENGQLIGSSRIKGLSVERLKKDLCYRNVVWHPTWFIKTEVFNKVGEYHDIPVAEDYELICRAITNNYKILNIDDILLNYRVRSGITVSNTFNQYMISELIKNEYKTAINNCRLFDYSLIKNKIHDMNKGEEHKTFNYAAKIYKKGILLINNKKFLLGVLNLTYSFIISPFFIKQLFETIKLNIAEHQS